MQERTSGAAGLVGLRRKLFIIAAYLVIAAAMLALVTYGQYKVSIDGTVNMTRAASVQASILLEYDLDDMDERSEQSDETETQSGTQDQSAGTNTVDLASFLTNLRPGDDAKKYAEDYVGSDSLKTGHWMRFNVYNYNYYNNDDVTSMPLSYHVRIKANYRLPLDIYLVTSDNGGKTRYHMTYVQDEGEYRLLDSTGAEERSFTFGTETESREFYAFVGWEPMDLNDLEVARQKASADLRKEVEVLQLSVVLNQNQADNGLEFINDLPAEEWIKSKLEQHINSVTSASTSTSEQQSGEG